MEINTSKDLVNYVVKTYERYNQTLTKERLQLIQEFANKIESIETKHTIEFNESDYKYIPVFTLECLDKDDNYLVLTTDDFIYIQCEQGFKHIQICYFDIDLSENKEVELDKIDTAFKLLNNYDKL